MNKSNWREFFVIWPRKIDGRWRWKEKAYFRMVYPHGALGILIGSEYVEYSMTGGSDV